MPYVITHRGETIYREDMPLLNGGNIILPHFKPANGEVSDELKTHTRAGKVRKVNRPNAQPKRVLSEKQRALYTSPEFKEHLRKLREKRRAEAEAAGVPLYGRRGPDGFRGKSGKRRLAAYMEVAKGMATNMIDKFIKDGLLDADSVSQAILIDQAAIVLARKEGEDGSAVPIYSARERMQAARLCLEWLKAKPTTKVEVATKGPDAFLMQVAKEANTISAGEGPKAIGEML